MARFLAAGSDAGYYAVKLGLQEARRAPKTLKIICWRGGFKVIYGILGCLNEEQVRISPYFSDEKAMSSS